jgi:hypothetical protein
MGADLDVVSSAGRRVPQSITYVMLAALVVLFLMMALWEYLTTLYLLALVAWLAVAGGLMATGLPRRLLNWKPIHLFLFVFVIAVAVRFIMLFQDAVITRDIEMFVSRGQMYLDGDVPYSEGFSVNKPPMYLYLASGLAATVGPWELGFRAIMGLTDALVALMLFMMARQHLSPRAGVMAGVLYGLNPISAVSVGISGHFDPVVVIFAMGGVWLALRGRRGWASLALGMGFALKLYPVVILPWVLLEERSWPRRVTYGLVFALPMLLSWVPILGQNPEALGQYAEWQGDWIPKKGIAYGIAMAIGWTRESTQAGLLGDLVEYVFLGLLVTMFLDWVRRRAVNPDVHLVTWFKVATVGYYLLYGFIFIGTVMDYRFDLGADPRMLGLAVGAIYFPLGALGLWWLWRRWLVPTPNFAPQDQFIMLAALSVTLLLMASTQYNPWYLLWLLPLVLLIQSWRVRDVWNALLIWNIEGLGVTIWPGFGFHPPPS